MVKKIIQQGHSRFAHGAYFQYVSAHGPQRAKFVTPKVRHNSENTAGGFFQHSLFVSIRFLQYHESLVTE